HLEQVHQSGVAETLELVEAQRQSTTLVVATAAHAVAASTSAKSVTARSRKARCGDSNQANATATSARATRKALRIQLPSRRYPAVAAAGVSPANDWKAAIDTPRKTNSSPARPAAAPKTAGTTSIRSR